MEELREGDWMEELRGELDGRIEGEIGWKN